MDEASEFAVLARDYCALVDRAEQLGRDLFLDAIEPKIARLYGAAAELPQKTPESEDGPGRISHEEWSGLFHRLEALFGDQDSFRVVFDPWSDEDAVFSSLSDCIADIYRDLRAGLAAFDAGDPDEANWEWRFGWSSHWGWHGWEALAAIHSLRHH